MDEVLGLYISKNNINILEGSYYNIEDRLIGEIK